MIIEMLTIGSFETNCYILRSSSSSKDCLVIDAGLEAQPLVNYLLHNNYNPLSVILTHGHVDHITGVELLRQNWPKLKIYIHKLDVPMLEGIDNLSELTGLPQKKIKADFLLEDGQLIEILGIKLKVLHTPGHSPGSICLYSQDEKTIFVGDTLFEGSVGRTDFPGGSTEQLLNSIKEKILTLPGNTKILPGHGPATTVAKEKKFNPFFEDFFCED